MMNAATATLCAQEKDDRRRYNRRRDSYMLWCAIGTKWVSAYGVDISASGLGLVVPVEINKEEVQFRASLDDASVTLRASRVWQQRGTFRGQLVHRYGLRITGIAPRDWDLLLRYCGSGDAGEDVQLTRLDQKDLARLVPYGLQNRMLTMLVQRKRLAPLDGKTPLVQYAYGGTLQRENATLHRVAIHSRVFDPSLMQTRSFDTRFLFTEDGTFLTFDE